MFLIVGLGNPGSEYLFTRHNVGFMFADYLIDLLRMPAERSKFSSVYSETNVNADRFKGKVMIQKPQTFMNKSGISVHQIVSFYKICPNRIVVIHDDIDLPPFEIRSKFGGGSGGHNGLKSIDEAIGRDYWRIRIGVGRPQLKEQVADYVLSNFGKSEIEAGLPPAFDSAIDVLFSILSRNDS
jgi:PTH1 family peptidyl-tRNA hydrolase